jgi:hypothetical protein
MTIWKPCPICKKMIQRDKLKAHMAQPRAHPSKSSRPPPDVNKSPLLEDFNEGVNHGGVNEGVTWGVSQQDILDSGGMLSEDDDLAGMGLLVGSMEAVEPIVVE